MYFASRVQAGRMLAKQLSPKYRYENCAVIALSDGGVVVGAQIAAELHCVLTYLAIEEINLPREPTAIGGVLEDGSFNFNQALSQGEIDDISSEFHGFIEQEKMAKFHHLNTLIGSGGLINKSLLRGHNIIIVSDGFKGGFSLDMVMNFIKPISVEGIIIAAPLSDVKAIDKMHIMADDIYCLSVVENYMDTPHYYDEQDIPNHNTIVKTIEQIILAWK